eukprot:5204730-Pleurochrysis_carterae.AAC.2
MCQTLARRGKGEAARARERGSRAVRTVAHVPCARVPSMKDRSASCEARQKRRFAARLRSLRWLMLSCRFDSDPAAPDRERKETRQAGKSGKSGGGSAKAGCSSGTAPASLAESAISEAYGQASEGGDGRGAPAHDAEVSLFKSVESGARRAMEAFVQGARRHLRSKQLSKLTALLARVGDEEASR